MKVKLFLHFRSAFQMETAAVYGRDSDHGSGSDTLKGGHPVYA